MPAGVSEQITGQALKNLKVPRENVVVATKVFGETGAGPNARGASRGHILDGVKASLKRLQLEHIDLYQIHGFDPATPIEETVRALDQLVRQGHRALRRRLELGGLADRQGAGHRRAAGPGALRVAAGLLHGGRARPRARADPDAAPAKASGLMVWSPLAGGLLSGKYGREQQGEEGSRRTTFDFPPVDRERA